MKNIKIWFQIFLLLTVVWFSSMGCVTKQVWTDPTKSKPYKEHIISFYSNVEKGEILFLGEQYHYIFNEGTPAFSILLNAKELLKLSDKNIHVYASVEPHDNRKVQANIMIHLKESELNKEQITWLEKNDFRNIEADPYYGTNHRYEKDENVATISIYTNEYFLGGTRYVANSEVNAQLTKLKKPIEIEVVDFYVSNEKSKLYKVAMTPLSVTADAGLVILGVGAAIIYAPFALTYLAIDKLKGE